MLNLYLNLRDGPNVPVSETRVTQPLRDLSEKNDFSVISYSLICFPVIRLHL